MLYSVIIPCYNSEYSIRKCLDSLIGQSYKDIEIICINDGSTDNTLKILKEYQATDSRIVVVDNATNSGVSVSRNNGVKISKGEYITFIDSDDYIDVDTFEKINAVINNVDILRYNFRVVNTEKEYNNTIGCFSNRKINISSHNALLLESFFGKKNNIPTVCWLLCIKNEIAKKIHFDSNMSFMEDSKYYYDALCVSSSIYFYDDAMYNYCYKESSLSRDVNRLKTNIKCVIYLNAYFKKHIKDEKVIRAINTCHIEIITNLLARLYMLDRKRYDDVLKMINNDRDFFELVKNVNYNKIDIGKKLYILSLKRKNKFLGSLVMAGFKRINGGRKK